jgi:hypothetical protein
MHVYSDYLQQLVRVPNFEITDDELILFDELFIPCQDEMIISLVKQENADMLDAHHTMRVPCNNATTGYSQ